ncbi:hypothetical protein ACA910_018737 [Epithemia clementina (nom. ined.)]
MGRQDDTNPSLGGGVGVVVVQAFVGTSSLSSSSRPTLPQQSHGGRRRRPRPPPPLLRPVPSLSLLYSTTRTDKDQNSASPKSEDDDHHDDDNSKRTLSAMEQLAREWSAMNRESTSSRSTSDTESYQQPPVVVQEDLPKADTSAHQQQDQQQQQQMNQLAQEWMARNRDDQDSSSMPSSPLLPLPEDAMANLPPQRSPFSFAAPNYFPTSTSSTGSSTSTVFRGQQQQQQQQPSSSLSSSSQSLSSSRLHAATPSFNREGGPAVVDRPPTVAESPETKESPTMHDDNDNDDMDKYVFIGKNGKRLDQDPDMQLVMSEAAVWKYFRKERPSFFGRLPLQLVLDRTWDTVEDILVHLRRIPYEKGWVELTADEEVTRKTVVVLGSGWAAHALMKVADCHKLRLIIVSPSNHFVFTPMLASAAVGTVEYRSMTEAVRAANPMIAEYLEGAATAVNLAEKTVTVKLNALLEVDKDEREQQPPQGANNGSTDTTTTTSSPPVMELKYDNLIVAVGARVDDRGIPGAEYCFRLKTTDDAKRLRIGVGQALEYASRPNLTPEERSRRVTILIVGGGPTGVELAGELHDLFADVTRPHKGTYPRLAGACNVVLVHGGPDLVPQFSPALRQEALRSLEKKGVQVILNTRVVHVGTKSATLSTKVLDPKTGKPTGERTEQTIPMGVPVWCAGTAPVPFVEELLQQLPPEARYRDGRVQVDAWMRPPMYQPDLLGSVLVLGDAAAVYDENEANGLMPSTAQVAGQQGAFVARLLDRNYDLTTTPPQLYNLMNLDVDDDAAAMARQWGEQQHHATNHPPGEGPTTSPDEEEDSIYYYKDNVFYDPALNLWLRFRGLERAPAFGFLNLGMLAYLGGGEALSQVQVGQVPILAWAGSVAFVLWRSVYLVKQVATRNRVLVTFDWIKSAVFGRDTTRL